MVDSSEEDENLLKPKMAFLKSVVFAMVTCLQGYIFFGKEAAALVYGDVQGIYFDDSTVGFDMFPEVGSLLMELGWAQNTGILINDLSPGASSCANSRRRFRRRRRASQRRWSSTCGRRHGTSTRGRRRCPSPPDLVADLGFTELLHLCIQIANLGASKPMVDFVAGLVLTNPPGAGLTPAAATSIDELRHALPAKLGVLLDS